MNAVNLIPDGRRAGQRRLQAGAPFLGLVAGLLLVLVAGVLYARSADTVSTREAQLRRTSAAVTGWKLAASRFNSFERVNQQHADELGQVRELAAGRYDWSLLLGQVAQLMPVDSELSSMQAAGPGSTFGSATSGIELTGCAASEPAVAQTMVQLRRVTGISNVALSSANKSGTGSSSASGSSSAACEFPVQFAMTLSFGTPSATASATPSSPTATGEVAQ